MQYSFAGLKFEIDLVSLMKMVDLKYKDILLIILYLKTLRTIQAFLKISIWKLF